MLSFGKVEEYGSPSDLMANPDSSFSQLLQELKKEEAIKVSFEPPTTTTTTSAA